jgi:hypothetical protein
VKNEGHVAQEFLIIPSLEQRSTRNLDQLALNHIVASQLPPKAISSFGITFTRPTAQGQLEFTSLLPERNEVRMNRTHPQVYSKETGGILNYGFFAVLIVAELFISNNY